jgi:pyruvate kinase
MAKTTAAFRPNLPVFAFTSSEKVRKKLNIHF